MEAGLGTRARRRWTLAGALLIGLVGTPLVAAGPAWAVAGLERVEQTSAADSNNKVVTALCPRGKVVVGGGGILAGVGAPFVHLTGVEPLSDGSGFQVRASEVEGGTVNDWVLRTFAMCVEPPPGWHIVTGAAVFAGAASQATAQATCTGSVLIGLGARIDAGQGEVGFGDVRPLGADKVTATAYEDWNGYNGTWSVTSIAICADAAAGVTLRVDTGQFSPASPKSMAVVCLAPSEVYGGGFFVVGGVGNVLLNDLVPAKPGTLHNLGASAYRHPTAPIAPWALALYAFCGP